LFLISVLWGYINNTLLTEFELLIVNYLIFDKYLYELCLIGMMEKTDKERDIVCYHDFVVVLMVLNLGFSL